LLPDNVRAKQVATELLGDARKVLVLKELSLEHFGAVGNCVVEH
jgi:hypothetical protein